MGYKLKTKTLKTRGPDGEVRIVPALRGEPADPAEIEELMDEIGDLDSAVYSVEHIRTNQLGISSTANASNAYKWVLYRTKGKATIEHFDLLVVGNSTDIVQLEVWEKIGEQYIKTQTHVSSIPEQVSGGMYKLSFGTIRTSNPALITYNDVSSAGWVKYTNVDGFYAERFTKGVSSVNESDISKINTMKFGFAIEADEYTSIIPDAYDDREIRRELGDVSSDLADQGTRIDALESRSVVDESMTRRVENLGYAAKDHLYRDEVTTSEDYKKQIPGDAMPWANLDQVGAKTLVWNQIVAKRTDGTRSFNGITATNNENGTYTINGTATSDVNISLDMANLTIAANHVYYIKGCPQNGNDATFFMFDGVNGRFREYGNGLVYSYIADSVLRMYARIANGYTATNLTFSPQVFDLTQMFGAGNEPTAEEFRAMFPADYYPHCEPTLMSFEPRAAASLGRNIISRLLPATVFTGTLANVNYEAEPSGIITLNGTATRVNTIILPPVVIPEDIKGKKIVFGVKRTHTKLPNNVFVGVFDVTGNAVNAIDGGAFSKLTTPNCVNVSSGFTDQHIKTRIWFGVDEGETYNNDKIEICAYLSDKDEGFIPHFEYTSNLSALVQKYFPDGMKSAGDVYDSFEVDDSGKVWAVQRVSNTTTDDGLAYIALVDHIRTEVTEPFPTNLNVEAGGSLTFVNQHGDDYRVPLPNQETFMIRVNAIDDLVEGIEDVSSALTNLGEEVDDIEKNIQSLSDDNVYKRWTDSDGYVLQSTGVLEPSADYVTTDFIPVRSNTISAYVEKSPSDGGIRFGFYDNEKTFIWRWVADASHPGLITTASGDAIAFVRLSYRKDGVIRSIATGSLSAVDVTARNEVYEAKSAFDELAQSVDKNTNAIKEITNTTDTPESEGNVWTTTKDGAGWKPAAGGGGDIVPDPDDPDGGIVTSGTLAEIDKSLTLDNHAADAKVVGEKITHVAAEISDERARAVGEEQRIEALFTAPTQEAVNTWLDAHPEATTTVQDGSLTAKKLVMGALGFITPEMFGAVGNGAADDTQAVKAWVAHGVTQKHASGIYRISNTVDVFGSNIVIDGGTFLCDAGFGGQIFNINAGDAGKNIQNVTIRNVEIDCSARTAVTGTSACIRIGAGNGYSVRGVTVEDCYLHDNVGYGVFIRNNSALIDACEDVFVKHCIIKNTLTGVCNSHVKNSVTDGCHIYGSAAENVTVDNGCYKCKVVNCNLGIHHGGAGNISTDESDFTIIDGNTIDNYGDTTCAKYANNGINFNGNTGVCNNVVISNNIIKGNTNYGLRLRDKTNTMTETGHNGMIATGNLTFTGNVFVDNAENDVFIENLIDGAKVIGAGNKYSKNVVLYSANRDELLNKTFIDFIQDIVPSAGDGFAVSTNAIKKFGNTMSIKAKVEVNGNLPTGWHVAFHLPIRFPYGHLLSVMVQSGYNIENPQKIQWRDVQITSAGDVRIYLYEGDTGANFNIDTQIVV